MIKIFLFLSIIGIAFNLSAQNKKEPETVAHVDLKKYTGLWYEIAKIPNSFQKSCFKNTTAEYQLKDDGEIKVINTCVEEDGEKNVAEGTARIVDKNSNAKLEVSFVSIFGINLFWGDYWIIGLGDNYEYAIIGHPERKYGWILSRSPTLPDSTLDNIFNKLKEAGYNPENFEMTKQEH